MGQAARKKKLGIKPLPDIPVSESQKSAALSLFELIRRETEDAQARIISRRNTMKVWIDQVMDELKLPKDQYVFDIGKMVFVHSEKVKGQTRF